MKTAGVYELLGQPSYINQNVFNLLVHSFNLGTCTNRYVMRLQGNLLEYYTAW